MLSLAFTSSSLTIPTTLLLEDEIFRKDSLLFFPHTAKAAPLPLMEEALLLVDREEDRQEDDHTLQESDGNLRQGKV